MVALGSASASSPLVSVIIPTWNRRGPVLEAVRSAQAQAGVQTQIIVVDDGSTDGTSELLCGQPGITYLYQRHSGQAAARNLGLHHARGEYIATLDSDDLWHPGFLRACLRGLDEFGAAFVFANWVGRRLDGSRSPSYLECRSRWERHCEPVAPGWYAMDACQSRRLFVEICPSPSSALLFRRQPYRYGWSEQMRICDDWCLLLDCVMGEPSRVAFTMEPLWEKRASQDSICDGLDPRCRVADDWYHDMQKLRHRFAGRLRPAEQAIMDKHELRWRLWAGRRLLLTAGQRLGALRLIGSALVADPAYVLWALVDRARRDLSLMRRAG